MLAAVAVATVGCAPTEPRVTAPPPVMIAGVPFFPDDTDQCGPSALASVISFWGPPTTPDELRAELYIPDLGGTLPMDLAPAAEARGLAARVYDGALDDLKTQIDRGRPLVVYLDLGRWTIRKGHFAVALGYDDARGGVIAHSGTDEARFIPYDEFIKQWERTDRWTLLVEPTRRAP